MIINNYIIKIGKSTKKKKEIIFKSKLSFNNKFYFYPFGTTKTRFEFYDIFNINLEILDHKEGLYTYKIVINRNDIYKKSRNVKYFYGDGWLIDIILY